MSVLVDTSVWVDHFRNDNPVLAQLLEQGFALTHPFVIGELACGTPPAPRQQTLELLGLLRECAAIRLPELLNFIEQERLYGMGCGLVDLALLSSTLITPGARLWTLDKRLAALAARFDVQYVPARH